ncbi:hypothetical protein DYB31_011745 [Aphanomyces astaci]|uniref:Peptidase M13 C-terminal domain-containing protein n=1 Tax=Aphanomyces astaci TaxID=112090 RepID=A0A397F8A5_APHAT|nr:hypothetical protein DYB31_011745 [Aphanomyces astaci]
MGPMVAAVTRSMDRSATETKEDTAGGERATAAASDGDGNHLSPEVVEVSIPTPDRPRMKDQFEVQGSILNRRTIIKSPLRNAVTTLVPVIPLYLVRSVLELCHDSALHDIFMTKVLKENALGKLVCDLRPTQWAKYTKEAGDELFYFSYDRAWCSKNTDASLLRSLWREHPPGRFRVTWALQSNAEYAEFARVFQCPTDSYLNPSKKCLLWE